MAVDLHIKAILTAVDKITAPVRRIARSVGGTLTKAFGRFTRFAKSATIAAAKFAKNVAMIGGVVGALAISEFGKFDDAMARIGTLLPEGADAMQTFGQETLSASVKFGKSMEDVANATFQAISALSQASTEEIKEFNKVVGEAATGGFTGMETVVDGLTNTINAFGLEVGQAREVSDAFFVANRLGKTTFEELSSEIGKVAPMAKALGVSYEELLSATVALTKGGLKTDLAMTGIRATLSGIAKPTKDAQKVARKYGIELSATAIKAKGFAGFLKDMVVNVKDNTEAQVALFGNVRAFNAIASLTSATGLKSFNESMAEMADRGGSTARAYTVASNTIGHKIGQVKQGMSALLIVAGEGLVKGLGLDAIESGEIPGLFEQISEDVGLTAKAFGGLLKEAGGVLAELGKGAGEFAAVVVLEFTAMTDDFDKWWETRLGPALLEVAEGLSDLASDAWDFARGFSAAVVDTFSEMTDDLEGWFEREWMPMLLSVEKSLAGLAENLDVLGILESDKAVGGIEQFKANQEVGAALGGGETTLIGPGGTAITVPSAMAPMIRAMNAAARGGGPDGSPGAAGKVEVAIKVEGAGARVQSVDTSGPVEADVAQRPASFGGTP